MKTKKFNQCKALEVQKYFNKAIKNGQNGALSAAGGSLNALAGKIALKTGVRWERVREILVPLWNDAFENGELQYWGGLESYPEGFHEWDIN